MYPMRLRTFITLNFLFLSTLLFSQNQFIVAKNNKNIDISGKNQTAIINTQLTDSIHFKVVSKNNKPIKGEIVYLKISETPYKSFGTKLGDSILKTNSQGICGTILQIGDKKGIYEITATINSTSQNNVETYRYEARSKIWIFLTIIGIFGGLVLFLFGMNTMSSGLQKTAGDKMRSILSTLTRNNFIGLIIGALVTGIIQSSSATSVMLVSFVNSGLMSFGQTLSILLGATIGSTITVQLISFNLTEYSLIFVTIGGALFMFANKNTYKYIGESIFGFGILFFGMEVMSESIAPIRNSEFFIHVFSSLQNPFLGLLTGAIFTAIIQSSGASIGIFIIIASQGLLTFESSLALVLGANLGTPVTALIAAIKTNNDSKRVAISLLFYKIILVATFIGFIPIISKFFMHYYHDVNNSESMPHAIANAHTVFNIIIIVILFPFLGRIEKFILKLKPLKPYEVQKKVTKYIDDGLLSQPAIAMQLAKEETLRLGRKIQFSLELIIAPFIENNPEYLEKLISYRLEAKKLRDEIKDYLLKISQYDKSQTRSEELFSISHTLNELSHINDALTKILHRRAEKWIERNYEFTDSEKQDIIAYHTKTIQLFNSAMQVFAEYTIEDALKVRKKAKKQSQEALELEKKHYQRLLELETEELTNSKTYLELINMFKIIGEHSVNLTLVIE